MRSKISRKIAAIALFAAISILTAGCSKDPAEPEKTPVLTSASLTDTIHAAFSSSYARECQIDIQLVYKIQDYSLIQSGSDSEEVKIYLNNAKIISTSSGFNVSMVGTEYSMPADFYIKTVDCSWRSDTTAYVLTASDTLTTVDSSVVNIWWWYKGSRQVFHNKF